MGNRDAIERFGRGLEVVEAQYKDCYAMAPNLRVEDRLEIDAAIGLEAIDGLLWACQASTECYTLMRYGKPIAMFGSGPIEGHEGHGFVWMLGTEDIKRVALTFLRHSKRWVERLMMNYKTIGNCVDARNRLHIRWLKWIGFDFSREVVSYGVRGLPFYEFSLCATST